MIRAMEGNIQTVAKDAHVFFRSKGRRKRFQYIFFIFFPSPSTFVVFSWVLVLIVLLFYEYGQVNSQFQGFGTRKPQPVEFKNPHKRLDIQILSSQTLKSPNQFHFILRKSKTRITLLIKYPIQEHFFEIRITLQGRLIMLSLNDSKHAI